MISCITLPFHQSPLPLTSCTEHACCLKRCRQIDSHGFPFIYCNNRSYIFCTLFFLFCIKTHLIGALLAGRYVQGLRWERMVGVLGREVIECKSYSVAYKKKKLQCCMLLMRAFATSTFSRINQFIIHHHNKSIIYLNQV
jgi:hypothetical protein